MLFLVCSAIMVHHTEIKEDTCVKKVFRLECLQQVWLKWNSYWNYYWYLHFVFQFFRALLEILYIDSSNISLVGGSVRQGSLYVSVPYAAKIGFIELFIKLFSLCLSKLSPLVTVNWSQFALLTEVFSQYNVYQLLNTNLFCEILFLP